MSRVRWHTAMRTTSSVFLIFVTQVGRDGLPSFGDGYRAHPVALDRR